MSALTFASQAFDNIHHGLKTSRGAMILIFIMKYHGQNQRYMKYTECNCSMSALTASQAFNKVHHGLKMFHKMMMIIIFCPEISWRLQSTGGHWTIYGMYRVQFFCVCSTPQRYLIFGSTRYYTIICNLIRLSHDINDIL